MCPADPLSPGVLPAGLRTSDTLPSSGASYFSAHAAAAMQVSQRPRPCSARHHSRVASAAALQVLFTLLAASAAPGADASSWPASAFPYGQAAGDFSVAASGDRREQAGWQARAPPPCLALLMRVLTHTSLPLRWTCCLPPSRRCPDSWVPRCGAAGATARPQGGMSHTALHPALQVDFPDNPMRFYSAVRPYAFVSDNGYLACGNTSYPYNPANFGNEADGAPKVRARCAVRV
jgi:hypothetical protein